MTILIVSSICVLSSCLVQSLTHHFFHYWSAMSLQTATTFNAEAHIALINQTFFANLKLDVTEFAIGQVCDSTNLNPRITTLLKISHIAACWNHCLNLVCKEMEGNCSELSDLATKTQDLHSRKIKASNKLSGELENIQLVEEGAVPQEAQTSSSNPLELYGRLVHQPREIGWTNREVIKSHPDCDLSDKTIT